MQIKMSKKQWFNSQEALKGIHVHVVMFRIIFKKQTKKWGKIKNIVAKWRNYELLICSPQISFCQQKLVNYCLVM